MELSDEERGSLCSPDQMVDVGGVQIPKSFWGRADAQTESFLYESSAEMRRPVSCAATLALLCEETEDEDVRYFLERKAFAYLDEAFMMYYADHVKCGFSHEDAFLDARDCVQSLPDDKDDKREKPFKAMIDRYLKLREKVDADA